MIKRAHQLAKLVDILFTDNCGIVSHFKLAKVHVIYGCESNIKIAYSIDIFITDKIFQIIKENISRVNLKNIAVKVLIVIGASSGIGQSIENISKSEGAIVYDFSRENGVEILEKWTLDAVFCVVFKENGKIDFIINSNAVILLGSHIGDGAIIGANFVVGSKVEPYTIVIGNPARMLRKRFDDDLINLLLKFRWWDKSIEEINNLIPILTCSDLKRAKEELRNKMG